MTDEPSAPQPPPAATRAAIVRTARAAEAEAEAAARARHDAWLSDLRDTAQADRGRAFELAEAAVIAERAYATAKGTGSTSVADLERLRKEALLARREAGKAETVAKRSEKAAREAKSFAAASGDALREWAQQCEMKPRIDAAMALWKKMSEVDINIFDANPWLLNCDNGTVDLRTGVLGPHRSDNYITKLIDLKYVPGARSVLWEETIAQIMGEADLPADRRVLCRFLQRWFGYCATGSVREQCFAVHWGDGSNGKSTIMATIGRVLGGGAKGYTAAAPPGLLTERRGDGDNRHPTEIAGLRGRRLVTAHESGEGQVLREAFIKHATGDDLLVGRFMNRDFFEFKPTHKLQLVTNHKPVIKGQDHGIWRRVLLIPYVVMFGTEDEVARGAARYLKDQTLMARLASVEHSEAVLAWIVEGARLWFEHGLAAPSAVLAAGEAYRGENDRVRQWLGEHCECGRGLTSALVDETGSLDLGGGLYPDYVSWTKESGLYALSKQRFLAELERLVPGFRTEDQRTSGAGGQRRRKILRIHGVRLLPE
jgi:putative DNA primase/helicase